MRAVFGLPSGGDHRGDSGGAGRKVEMFFFLQWQNLDPIVVRDIGVMLTVDGGG